MKTCNISELPVEIELMDMVRAPIANNDGVLELNIPINAAEDGH